MGGVAAFVFERALSDFAELPGFFGMQPDSVLDQDAEAARVAANNAAFTAMACSNAGLALLSAAFAWFTQVRRFGR
jgi:hypothetical protein